MKMMKFFSLLLAPLLLLPALPVESSAATVNFTESFEAYSEGTLYSKLWSTAEFTVKSEGGNQYLHMPFFEENKDAAATPFSGTVSPTLDTLSVSMELRPVHVAGNAPSEYDFRVRNYTYTDVAGTEQSGKWITFFRLHLDAGGCKLTSFQNGSVSEVPLRAGEWNTVSVNFDLVAGTYTVLAGDSIVYCDLRVSNFGFAGNQLQFNQMLKSCTYAATAADASYVDLDNIRIKKGADLSRYEKMFSDVYATPLRLDVPVGGSEPRAGLRFVSTVDTALLDELMEMQETGEALGVTFGTLISPLDYLLSEDELSLGIGEANLLDVRASYGHYYADGCFAGSIVNIREKNLGRTFVARPYVSILLASGQSATFYGKTVTACAKTLAAEALDAGFYETERARLAAYAAAPEYREGEELRVMSYNVYYSNLTEERMGNVVSVIRANAPDVMGLQEVMLGTWSDYLLAQLGDLYAYLGHGREPGGTGEGTPIMYRKDKFDLIRSETRWLSDTPTVCSKYPESYQYRIFTYAILERKSDGQRFTLVNTHLDASGGQVPRLKQVASLSRQLEELGLWEYPLILTGDMNAVQGVPDGEIDRILAMGVTNAMDVAIRPLTVLSNAIDFCFVEREHVTVKTYTRDDTQFDGTTPSDHIPVITDVVFK